MPERPIASVLGLRMLGGSLALALQQSGRFQSVIGWDPDFDVARQAQKLNLAQRYTRTAPDAVRQAAIVFLAVTPVQLRETLVAIAPHLQAGAVVCSLDEAHEPANAQAEELLPGSVSFISAHPSLWATLHDQKAPATSIFQQGVLCLSPLTSAHPHAVASVTDLAEALGMTTYFASAREHDAFISGVGRLPSVLAAALVRVVSAQRSWRELSRLAGGEFRQATACLDADPTAQQEALSGSRDHLVRWLDAMLAELSRLRDALRDAQEPVDFYAGASEARQRWLRDRSVPPHVADLPAAQQPAPRRRFWS